MKQWRIMHYGNEFEYARRMAKMSHLLFYPDIKDQHTIDPLTLICNEDEHEISLTQQLPEAIERLKNSTKKFFEFNGLMYCKIPDVADQIVIMDVYKVDIRQEHESYKAMERAYVKFCSRD